MLLTLRMVSNSAVLGIKGSGTHTTWALVEPSGKYIANSEAGFGNAVLLSDAHLFQFFKDMLKKKNWNICLALANMSSKKSKKQR